MGLLSSIYNTGKGLLSSLSKPYYEPPAISSYDSGKLQLGTQAKSPAQNLVMPKVSLSTAQAKTSSPATSTPQSLNGLTIAKNSPIVTPKPQTNTNAQFSQGSNAIPVIGSTPAPKQDAPIIYGAGTNPNTGTYQRDGVPQYSPVTPIPNPTQISEAPQEPQKPDPYTVNNGLYGQLITDLANRSQQSGADYQAANQRFTDIAKQQSDLSQQQAQKTYEIGARPGDTSQATGEQGLLNQLFASRQAALTPQYNAASTQLGAANTQQQLQYNALGSAISGAAPQAYGYNQQVFNPVTGQMQGGGSSLNDAVQGVVQKLQNGTMTYTDAQNALAGYGQGGINALQQALPQNFNIAQSNTLGGLQGAIGPAYQMADTALTNVENLMKNVMSGQKTNIPAVNSISNYFSTQSGLGSEETRAVTGAVQTLRNNYAALLASSKGGTPTDYSGQAAAEIPDQPTPNDIAALRHNLEVLGQARKDIYSNPGMAGQNQNANQPANIFSW